MYKKLVNKLDLIENTQATSFCSSEHLKIDMLINSNEVQIEGSLNVWRDLI